MRDDGPKGKSSRLLLLDQPPQHKRVARLLCTGTRERYRIPQIPAKYSMPSVFLPDDVLAAALAALEAQGGSIGAPLAALRTHLAATAVHDASSSPSLTVPPSSTLPGPTGCSPPTTMSHARSPPTVALPANTLPADTFPSARHRCRTLTVRARARSVPLPDDYYLLEHCFRSLPHHPVDTAMGTALGSSAMSQPFAAPSDFDFDFSPVASPIRSSPTLQGSSPAKDAGKLSPLRLPTPFDFTLPPASSALFNPMSPLSPMSPMTPTFPPLQSSPSPPVLLGKRRAAELEEEEEEEGEEEEGEHSDRDGDYADAPPLKIRIRRVCRCTGTAGDDGNGGGGGGGGGGGPGPVHLWTKDCVRRGDRGRVGQDSDIGQMPCHVDGCEHQQCQEEARGGSNGDEENNSQEGSRKRPKKAPAAKKGQVGWCVDEEGGPILTKAGGKLLGQLLGVFGRHHRQALEAVLRGPSGAAESSIGRATDTAALVKRLVKQSEDLRIAELERMVTLVQLALNVDSEQRDAKLKCLRNVSLASLAKTHGQAQRTFAEWVEHGHRLLLLCAAGSMYLLPVIAALELRTTITRQCTARDLISVASALRSVKHGQWLPMVRRMMVPLHYMRGCAGWIQSFTLHYTLPCKQGADAETKVLHLYDMKELDGIYDDVQTNYVRLPERSAEWEVTTLPLWKPLEDPERLKLPTPRTIKTPLDLSSAKNRKCPVTRKNRDRFTDTQRVHAGNAHVATSVDDLESHLKTNHAGGQNTPGVYVEAGGSTLNGSVRFDIFFCSL
ncbi:hypothetical protein C8R47DRAFT_336271 [Mycena vitilis]|nr:hypothetical protein C8R47DRAFT_336271 [Mycena vitilis]